MRTVPGGLAAHLALDATTVARLIKMRLRDNTFLAFTTSDAAITFNDGAQTLTYSPLNGVAPQRIEASADLNVDNTEVLGWVEDTGITEQQIRAGLFRGARLWVYAVNAENPGAGGVLEQYGLAGEPRFGRNGWAVEIRSLSQLMKQPFGDAYSLTCRRRFGDAVCGVALSWAAHTITAVNGTEPDRILTAAGLTNPAGFYVPGVLRVLTGQNAGYEVEIESQAAGVLGLYFPAPYPFAVGDTFEIRRDCPKTREACRDIFGNLLNFDGEPDIPVGDGGASGVPGALVSSGGGGGG